MKKLLLILLVSAAIPVLASDSTSSPIIEKFTAAFPHATNVKWYFNSDNAEVYYNDGAMQCHSWYDLEGRIIKTRRYYSEKELNPYLKSKLEQQFPGKKIFGVTEISNPDEICYEVVLEDSKRWTYVKCDPTGEMVVTKRLKKA